MKNPFFAFLSDALHSFRLSLEYKKAMRNLVNLEWSTDLLVHLLLTVNRKDVKVTLTNIHGITLTLEKLEKEGVQKPYVEPSPEKAFFDYIGLDEQDVQVMKQGGLI